MLSTIYHFPRHRSKRARVDFTLVELLVVVAIISVLASLLLPALGRARESARAVACVNNLKQMEIAVGMYIDENEDWVPPFYGPHPSANGSSRDFPWFLAPYLGEKKMARAFDIRQIKPIFRCPTSPLLNNLGGLSSLYGANPNTHWYLDVTTFSWFPAKSVRHLTPGTTISIADTGGDGAHNYERPQYRPGSAGNLGYWHNKRNATGFLDGHVELLRSHEITSTLFNPLKRP